MKLRPETESDYAAIATVVTQAFGQANEAQLIDRIRSSDRYCPSLALVAEQEGAIVGHILFSYVDLVGEESRSILSLAPVAVQPAVQKQGIGSALVQAGLTVADSLGEALIVVLGHPQFYPRFGFKPSVEYAIESPFPVPDAAFMVKPLQHFHVAYRGRVVYPSAFNDV
ncbi:N-acetyltransferase [Phormidium sp. FACHB-592]|uniref:N-acetyltransferase n=1 Tax=Stenomitos frigidus AS-A4 TaxID=2933935 RepID=A0ABV0KDL3_9CYAN|nr:N-acetyltransferase [Phormidium sp. FACHB-592]MBD2075938.1 N-acetyltransferase [Phormidium sp. FACHB-592]